MPWKIVNLDYACDRPHLHLKDPHAPIHLRSYFDEQLVEIGLGGEDPDTCFVRATVSADAVAVDATKFQALHVQILQSILASLDVEPEERAEALAWMKERMPRDDEAFAAGNVDAFAPPSGWPYDLTDEALVISLKDSEGIPSTRWRALVREAKRRDLPVEAPAHAARPARPMPEILRRR
jgi:hypothetical protein